jgi:hypothetical protein
MLTDRASVPSTTISSLSARPPLTLKRSGGSLSNCCLARTKPGDTLSVALTLQRKGQVPLVRMGTDLKRDEPRGHPIIAIGSFSNPWTQENVSGLRFTFDRGASDNESPRIGDARNPNRSWSLASIYPEPQKKDYAIVTRTFDPVTREPFVSLAGLHTFGNQIAGEFVSQESSWNEVARRAPVGWEKMNLKIVLESDIIGTTPSSPKIVDVYFWK